MTTREPLISLRSLFDAAVPAADPALIVPRYLPEPPKGRTIVVGVDKAAAVWRALGGRERVDALLTPTASTVLRTAPARF
jgi:glycerate-2-kinase